MRVALVGPFPLHLGIPSGGVESSFSNLIEGLMSFEAVDVHTVTCSSVLRKRIDLEHNGVTYHYLPSLGRLETLSLFALDRHRVYRALREIKPDIVHALNTLGYGYICLGAKYPVVMSIHGIVREERRYASTTVERLRATVASLLVESRCVKNARYIIQPTRYPEQYFGKMLTGKTYNIANPVADKFFDVSSSEEEGRLLYAGFVIPLKRLLDLIQALDKVRDQFPNVSLRVAGGTPDREYLRLIREWVTAHDLEENVEFLGSLTQDELVKEYERCVLLVLPSAQENSPMVIAEAMAAGKPVIATRVGGVPYLIDDGQTGFVVDVGDVDALASRILTILSDTMLAAKMGRAAKEKANLNFRTRIVAAKTLEVYREAIDVAGN